MIKWLYLALIAFALISCKADISIQQEPEDTVVQEFALAFIERSLPMADQDNISQDLFTPAASRPGAKVIIKKNAFAASSETDITSQLFADDAAYDVKDLALSADGNRLLFALRAPEIANVDDEFQPKWNIWHYDRLSDSLTPIIADPLQAEAGHDINPAFLPDGRIIFSSSRQKTARQILLDEFKPQYTALDESLNDANFNLHVMNADGSNIQQLSFNLSHDLYPVVLENGKILFSRWDNHPGRSMLNWYQMQPDGTETELVYGWHSHDSGADNTRVEYSKAIVLDNGEVSVALSSNQVAYFNSWPQQVALAIASDNLQPLYAEVLNQPAQTPLFPWAFSNSDIATSAGAVNSYFPLKDGTGRYLVSWSPCRVMNEQQVLSCAQVENIADYTLAAPLYGLWLFDNQQQTQVPVRLGQDGKMLSEPVVMQAFARQVYLPDNPNIDPELAAQDSAILDIRSVYDLGGETTADIAALADPMQTNAQQRPARYLRLLRGVPIPPEEVLELDNSAFGVNRNQQMRDILGTVAIAPDGSVRVKVPANIPFNLAVLNADGQAISPIHRNWLTLRPGEIRSCNGCHTADNTRPHGRLSGEWPSVNPGLDFAGLMPNIAPTLSSEAGETLAQTSARVLGTPTLTPGLSFIDIWTDPAQREPDSSVELNFANLTTAQPAGSECFDQWQARCRLRIDYPTHIQPLWQLDRRQFSPLTSELLQDNTCVSCHSRTDAAGNTQLPAAQLELDAEPSDLEPNHFRSYRELLSPDNEQELVADVLVDRMVQATDANGNLLFLTDADGNLILDENDQPIAIMVTVLVSPTMRAGSAANSSGFFSRFAATGSHANYLTATELALISTWLDIGGQYYNSPFAVVEP
ncbi:hypothetical protein BI198_13720 [Rheinheimera salexigens]|uniref:Hydrazine synthase alpha subunit middle domain-containing protein n=1 Tax=Rheinheimera salexigens TaxID=1628148 RepID=A0A1E7QAR2_9GAMM|nr:hypothetical protein BI198_13720 [Rheinheimera salexigens]